MIKATNLKLDRTLKLKGHTIAPGETALVDCKESDVKGNLFVRLGYLHIDAGKSDSGGKAPGVKELKAEIEASDDVDRLYELMEDSRKTVSEAAAARIEEIEGSGDDDPSSEGGAE